MKTSKSGDIKYSVVRLNEHSQETLKRVLDNFLLNFYYDSMELLFTKEYDVKCHHMTIKRGALDNSKYIHMMNTQTIVNIKVTHIGWSDKAIAVGVKSSIVKSENKIAHITLAVITKNGGEAKDSNDIKNWKLIKPFIVKGQIKQYLKI